MIRHIVLVRFRPELRETEIAPLWEALRAVAAAVPGAGAVVAARSDSPEQIERGYQHGFTVDFDDWDALAAYQAHPDHQRLGARLTAMAEGGRGGLLVVDLPTD